jgi:hypothetical protein
MKQMSQVQTLPPLPLRGHVKKKKRIEVAELLFFYRSLLLRQVVLKPGFIRIRRPIYATITTSPTTLLAKEGCPSRECKQVGQVSFVTLIL